ncbi:MAG: threo-3-hydroxy-L-aspartate ammonia-lyase [Solirubrobacteraceae bacterium]|nr:threo-3-hydroxy-L-aspartate ammonia-lyase [Solirubrobacteraceae bacterium]
MITLADVQAAAERLRGVAEVTPVFEFRGAVLKAENLQRTGSFKFRGAYNAISQVDATARGIVAASSGNHAQAVALAAHLHGFPATIVMPLDAAAVKRAGTLALGAEIVDYDRYAEDREAVLGEYAAERGLEPVHPFEDPRVMAGQGTVALELLAQAPDIDVLIVPVGGGGLISGCATVAAAVGVRVVGVEPEAGDDTRRSLAAGERVTIPVPRTIADGQQAPAPGVNTFPIVQRLVSEIVTVSDDEIRAAMRIVHDELGLTVEPSGATGLAAFLGGRVTGERPGIVLTGGNVDPAA